MPSGYGEAMPSGYGEAMPSGYGVAMPELPGRAYRLRSVILDCGDAEALAVFYAELLGGQAETADPEWCEVYLVEPALKLGFQRVVHYVAPEWPSGQPQQVHLDFTVPDLKEASTRAVGLGARVLDGPVDEGACVFQVHADPAGHPFCFCQDRPAVAK